MARLPRGGTVAAMLSLLLVSVAPAPAGADHDASPRYRNPISAGFADTFADPVIIRGHDGFWYAYGTTDPLREGERVAHRIPIARSSDLVTWTHAGDAFAPGQQPPYATSGASFWAPDVRFLDGRYVMYFTVTDTTVSPDGGDFAIGAATAPSPTGPWTVASEPVIAPRPGGGGGWLWTIDPAQFTDIDGRKYLYYGSYYGGISVTELSTDGLHAIGEPTLVGIDNRFEGAHVVRRDGYYYLFASSANCCVGPATGYAVKAGRATSPRGPFVDRDGVRLDISRAGGTPVVAQNGNRWIGAGHNGLLTDLSGQDWLVYHAIDRADPYLDEPFGVNERPMLLDRLDWMDGWPTVRAGAGPSETPTQAPVTRGFGLDDWRVASGRWSVSEGQASGSGKLVSRRAVGGDLRIETDVRLAGGRSAGLSVGGVTVRVDIAAGQLVVQAGRHETATALPAGFIGQTWHNLAVEVRDRRLVAQLSPARLGDQIAVVSSRLDGHAAGHVSLLASGQAEFDNVSAARLYRPVSRAVPVPRPHRLLREYSDEFNGDAPGAGWQWVRPDPAATVHDGALHWPLQGSDLVGTPNVSSILLHDAPAGDYLVETKMTLDLGEDTVRNYQQAGLLAYVNDDHFGRLTQVAIWNTRQVEFAHETPFAGGLVYGGNIVGTPAATTWLRLVHRIDPANGEHEFRAASSRDGVNWTWGGVWTFPAGSDPRIGLIAQGGAQPPVAAEFDYVRFYSWR